MLKTAILAIIIIIIIIIIIMSEHSVTRHCSE